jgi:hypothetical protein
MTNKVSRAFWRFCTPFFETELVFPWARFGRGGILSALRRAPLRPLALFSARSSLDLGMGPYQIESVK